MNWTKIKAKILGERPIFKRVARIATNTAAITDALESVVEADKTLLPPGIQTATSTILDVPASVVNLGSVGINTVKGIHTIATRHTLDCSSLVDVASGITATGVTTAVHLNGTPLPESIVIGGTVGTAARKIGDMVCPIFEHKPVPSLTGAGTETGLSKVRKIRLRGPQSLNMLAEAQGGGFLEKVVKQAAQAEEMLGAIKG